MQDLEEKFAASVQHSTEKKVIAETYIEGPEFSVNAYIMDGETKFVVISDRITWADHASGIIHKHRIPSANATDDIQKKILKLASKTTAKIGIKNGPVYFQIKLGDDGPKLIEVTPRLDGCHLWRLIKYATGVDLLETTVNHLTGAATKRHPNKWY